MNRQQIKKWSLLRHLNFKGYKRTASGNPLNMVKVMFPSQLTIYGNAVQDGTPSPDAPVEVQLCGNRTNNLLDVDLIFSGSVTISSILYTELHIEPNTIYTLSTNVPKATASICNVFIKSGSDSRFSSSKDGVSDGSPRSVTTGDDGCLLVGVRNSLSQNNFHDGTYRIMLIEGSYTADTLPAYEPYGYKVSGRAEGLNLLDYDVFEAGAISGSTGTDLDNSLSIRTGAYIEICPNTRYHISFAESLYLRIIFYASDKSFISQIYVASGSYSFTTPDQTFYIRLSLQGINNQLEPSSIQAMLVQGSYTAETMPSYEPYQPPQDFAVYLPEQIAKVGDVADEVVVDMEKQTAELKKNVGSMTMSDSYSGGISITDEFVRFYHGTTPLRRISPSTNIIDVMSDIYEADTWNNLGTGSTDKQFVIAGNPSTQVVNVRVPKSVIGGETNELMNAWAANNPATVYYVLATPVTTDITSLQQWDAMPNIEGTVSITFDSTIPISNAEAEYHSKEYDAT